MTTLELLQRARGAKGAMALARTQEKNNALLSMADALLEHQEAILTANQADLEAARGTVSEVMLDRLALTEERIETDSTYDAGTTTQLMWGARSDVGCVRPHNEDSYLVQSPLFCVCDGMGGHAAGEVASSIAVETIAKTAPQSADAARLADSRRGS